MLRPWSLRSWFGTAVLLILAVVLTLPHVLPGQSTAEAKVRLITLGTRAGEFPAPYRAQAANALIIGSAVYIIDAGDGAGRRLAEAGIDVRNVDDVFLTHLHDDHTSGLLPLIDVEWEFHRKKPVGIYGPPETTSLVEAGLRFLEVNSEIRLSDGTQAQPVSALFAAHNVSPGLVYQDSNISVRAVENTHFRFANGTPAYGKTKSYSYRFQTPSGIIVFTGDTGPSEAVTALAQGADLLVSEVSSVKDVVNLRIKDGSWASWTPEERASFISHMNNEHLSPEEVAKMAAGANVGAVVLTHLPPTVNPHESYGDIKKTVEAGFSGTVFVAQDLSEFDLSLRRGQRPLVTESESVRNHWLEVK